MDDIEEVKKRLRKRKGKVNHKPLTDNHFKKLYNLVIKGMVVMLVVLSIVTYMKIYPGTNVKEYILNDTAFKSFTTWVSSTFLGFLPTEDLPVNAEVTYTHVEEDFYTNNTNEVINFQKGKVIYTDTQEMVGAYVVVLMENDVQVTYSAMSEVFVSLYDEVDQGMVIGTYNEELILQFEYLGKEIDYETYLGME